MVKLKSWPLNQCHDDRLFDGLAGSFTPLADTEVERKGEFAGRVVRLVVDRCINDHDYM